MSQHNLLHRCKQVLSVGVARRRHRFFIKTRPEDCFAVLTIPNSFIIHVGNLKIDINKRQVHKNEQRIRLTGIEFSLLELLVNDSGKIFSRLEILRQLWGFVPEMNTDTRVVDVHISRLRTKVESDPNDPEFIITARGNGYFFPRIIDSEQE